MGRRDEVMRFFDLHLKGIQPQVTDPAIEVQDNLGLRLGHDLRLGGHGVWIAARARGVTERVVLFNDNAPDGRSYTEVYGQGLALCRGVIALPHFSRLQSDPEGLRESVEKCLRLTLLVAVPAVLARIGEALATI